MQIDYFLFASIITLDVSPSELNEEITSELDGAVLAYNIKLMDGTKEVQPNCTIRVTISAPYELNVTKAKIFRQEANGSFTDMNAVYEHQTNTMYFETDHLSLYVLVNSSEETIKGDVNGDGKITATDLIFVRRYIVHINDDISLAADMNNDGKVTSADFILLRRLYMNMQSQN